MSDWPHSPTCTPDCPGHFSAASTIDHYIAAAVADVDGDVSVDYRYGADPGSYIRSFLLHLPPWSVVVDGRVVDARGVLGEWVGYDLDDQEMAEFVDAAREVADRG